MTGFKWTHLDVSNQWLGLFTSSNQGDPDQSTVSTRIVPPPGVRYMSEEHIPKSPELVRPAHIEEVTEDKDREEPLSLSTTTGGTRQPYHRPLPPNWWNQVNTQWARNDEIRDTGQTKIPDQGVVFDNHLPWDVWANPLPLEAGGVKWEIESKPPTPPPKDLPYGITIQFPRSRTIYPTRRMNRLDPLIISPPVDSQPAPIASRRSASTSTRCSNLSHVLTARTKSPSPIRGPSTIPGPGPSATVIKGQRGFMMPLASTIHMITPGVVETDESHRDAMIDWLMGNVRERLGQPYQFPDRFKQSTKPNSSNEKKYSGTSKFSDLETWLVTVTNHFALSRLGGLNVKIDRLRVDFLQSWLEGEALNWYNRHVVESNRSIPYWTFWDVVKGLYNWFIHASSMQDTREGFRKVTYSVATGIQTFYDSLLDHAQNMAILPDDYTILEQFLAGLSSWIATKMFEDFGLSPESNSLDDFIAMAKTIKQWGKTKTYYGAMKKNVQSNASKPSNRASPKTNPTPHQYM